ncbi:hypothetical protein BU17DRAFT_66524 [Hysterangium stoloniferum]|nr:hypothetical protein BU17DRAFT_66524 [Hysterangium stoloniferum]
MSAGVGNGSATTVLMRFLVLNWCTMPRDMSSRETRKDVAYYQHCAEVNGIDVDVVAYAEALHLVRHTVITHIHYPTSSIVKLQWPRPNPGQRDMRAQPHMVAGLESMLASMAGVSGVENGRVGYASER